MTDEITSRTSGLLGEKSVSIMPKIVKKGETLTPVTPDTVIYANEAGSVESTLKELQELSDKIEVTLDGFIDTFDTIKKEQLLHYMGNTARNLDKITTELAHSKTVDHIISATKNIDEAARMINQPKKLAQIIDNFAHSSVCVNNIFTRVEKGEGSIGRLLMRDDFYLKMSSLLSKAEVILNDINHYGVLFHLDKGWQRLRARRLNLLNTLRTPQEFRNYFNDEIDSISVTLERVAMVIEEVESLPCQALWEDPQYVKVYAELLRRVASLEEYLKMYNQQVVDHEVSLTEFNYQCEG
jgi:phospholipid/cholesterol/gamma-HCH transport system substrate-binding protein